MPDEIFDKIFAKVPSNTREEIIRFRTSHPMKSIAVNNQDWDYIDCGAGNRTLVIVPGGLRQPHIGWRLVEKLEERYRIITPSYPPTGSMSVLAEGVISVLDQEGINDFAILGSSYGGLVVQCILQAVPDRVTHAIIANTGTLSDDPSMIKLLNKRLRLIRILPGRIVTWIAQRAFKRMVASVEEKDQVIYHALLEEVFARKMLTKREFIYHFEGLIDFQLNHEFTPEDTRQWKAKILLIKSSDDPGVLDGASEALDRMYPHADSYLFHDGGHVPSITRAEEYLRLITDFLEIHESSE